MEQSLLSLTYKGSILEAISEAKVQRKLFVVYISGEDAESARMEETTWRDFHVSESLSKYCIFLHVLEGSTDASNFSKIYPQGSVPCITAIGYNGVKLWENEGFIGAEDLALGLEKAWLSLHVQETAASVFTAALAARKSEQSGSHASSAASIEQGSSSRTAANSSSDEHNQGSDTIPLVSSEILEEKRCCEDIAEKIDDEKSSSLAEAAKGSGDPSSSDLGNNSDDCKFSHIGKGNSVSEEAAKCSSEIAELPESNSNESNVTSSQERPRSVEDVDIDATCKRPSGSQSMDVHLSIRLPNSISLQHKFSVTSTLRVVKEYVDKNQDGNINSYNLAIPYPRKVFTDQDLDRSLLELQLVGRQALMVVPLERGTNHNRGGSLSQHLPSPTDDSSDGNNGGYFGIMRRILSYVNPLSYLGGTFRSSDPTPPPNNLARMEGPNLRASTNQNTSTGIRAEGGSRRPTSSPFGSNIHTLKRDEDDNRFGDRNSFWNGNSTQYGGDGDGR
ncbi:plant UBX domain-containing protein 11 [Rhodamnia argentea]|uniref:Plant UBX domain-containing protein 11 n=1 Tax=Rhodamnia argentea TaxID=178133 RepID=A0A8B8P042_9MYRT|nr:plant UBX domain-containing protein 11 [Rhodamnia argentea]XP_048127511.1 plant UBX domain-containing protein 11 [Rhodamnia argentea]